MERIQVQAILRPETTKGSLKKLRQNGWVPGIVYGRLQEPVKVAIDAKALAAVVHSPGGINTLIDLSVDGKAETVIIKQLERDILYQDRIIHVDFLRISLKDKLEVQVPVLLAGEAKGVKEGGILQQPLREVTVKCLPAAIPEHLELDVSSLDAGQSLTVADLLAPKGVEIITDPAEVVATIALPRAAGETEENVEAKEAVAEREEAENGEKE